MTTTVSLPQAGSSFPPRQTWDDPGIWTGAVKNAIDFFNKSAWDPVSGSYASEIDEKGAQTSDIREPVPLGRMIYANAKAGQGIGDLAKARASADFLIQKMMARDELGVWFRSGVAADGRPAASGRPYTFSFEQAYPIAGLVALYAAAPETNADLLPVIRDAANSFWKRFWDPKDGGFFYYYNFASHNHTNDQGQSHKSYQSTIYPLSSFLMALRDADSENQALYDDWINGLLDVAMAHVVQGRDGEMTGWLTERMASDFTVDDTYVMTEAGHMTQLSWVLQDAVAHGVVKGAEKQTLYRATAKTLLTKFLLHGGISPKTGCVYDAFDRTTGRPLRDKNGEATSAWWSNLEAIIAYAKALRGGLFDETIDPKVQSVLNGLTTCYLNHFVDKTYGGEYFRVDAETGVVVDATKGNAGKSAYHITEAYQHLLGR